MQPDIIQAQAKHLPAIQQLFRQTIERVSVQHYTLEQVAVWASGADDNKQWQNRLTDQYFVLAMMGEELLGFSSLQEHTGYLDMLFVHHAFQGQGIGAMLLNNIIAQAKEKNVTEITTEASITAKPLFEKMGFVLLVVQDKQHKGLVFRNYKMSKQL